MKVTKYEHACFTVEVEDETLIVDPSIFAKSMPIPDNVGAIVVTHGHEDHFDPELVERIFEKNPDTFLISVQSVVDQIKDHGRSVAKEGEIYEFGPFKLEFFGARHAPIHDSMDTGENVGVMINDTLYYPGDSFTEPHLPVSLLALPTSGPWLKMGEIIDFVTAIKAKRAFSVHDFHSSDAGKELVKRMTGHAHQQVETEYIELGVGESLEA